MLVHLEIRVSLRSTRKHQGQLGVSKEEKLQ
jgi:hypothetical protein